MPLIDLHSHILPGLDDGAQNDTEALEMLRIAAADGIDIIAATPHADRATPDQILEGAHRLNELARQEGLAISVVPGSEVRIDADLPERHEAAQLVTLNQNSYLLLELWLMGDWPPYLRTAIYDCQRAGLMPILAHAERYPAVQRSPMIVADLVAAGVLIQINAGSLLHPAGSKTRDVAETLLRSHLVHVIASDAHHATLRAPRLQGALDYARSVVGHKYLGWIEEAAGAILAGEPVLTPEPRIIQHKSRLVRIWDRIASN